MAQATGFVTEIMRLARYSLVGGLALIVHAAIAFSLIIWADVPATLAHFLGFSAGFLIAVQGHIRFTFRSTGTQLQLHRRFFIVCAAALLISELVLVGLISRLKFDALLAQAGAIAVSCAVSYAGSRLWAFQSDEPTPPRTSQPGVGPAA